MRSRLVWTLLLVVLGVAVYVGNVLATPGAGFSGTTLAMATYGRIQSHVHTLPADWQEMIETKGLSDLYVQLNTWQPGGNTGWHTHPGPSFVIVTQGSVTVYDGDDPACTPHVYTAGTPNNAFVDSAAATCTSSGTRPMPSRRRTRCSSFPPARSGDRTRPTRGTVRSEGLRRDESSRRRAGDSPSRVSTAVGRWEPPTFPREAKAPALGSRR